MSAAIPIIATTISISMSVKPVSELARLAFCRLIFFKTEDTPIAGRQLSNWHADYFAWSYKLNSLILNIFHGLLGGRIRQILAGDRQFASQRGHILCCPIVG